MSAANNGGHAFPQTSSPYHDGMTLRDYFAGQALIGICSMVAQGKHDSRDLTNRTPEEKLALDTYRMADAMLKARQA